MKTSPTEIPEVLLIEPKLFRDDRGFFLETFQVEKYAQAGVGLAMVQDNLSGSRGGVLRGLHYQLRHAQGKLVSIAVGAIFDVAVDLRRASPTFGRWVGVHLAAEQRQQLWVPPGFAHGFYVTSEWAEVSYKVTAPYDLASERTLAWDDATLRIDWPLVEGRPPLVSAKDARGKSFEEAEAYD